MAQCTMQTEASLRPCAEELRDFMEVVQTSPWRNMQNVQQKYRLERRFAVSTLSLPRPDALWQLRDDGA